MVVAYPALAMPQRRNSAAKQMLPREAMISSSVQGGQRMGWMVEISHPAGVCGLPPIAVFGVFLSYNGLANVTSCRGRSSSSLLCSETGAPIRNSPAGTTTISGQFWHCNHRDKCDGRPAICGVKLLAYAGLRQRRCHRLFCRNRKRLLRISAPYENISGGEYSGHRSAGWHAYACAKMSLERRDTSCPGLWKAHGSCCTRFQLPR